MSSARRDEPESCQRAGGNVENRINEPKLGLGLDNPPSQIFNANWAYLLSGLLAVNLLVWLKMLALPTAERSSYAKRLGCRFIAVAGSVGKSRRRLVLRLQAGLRPGLGVRRGADADQVPGRGLNPRDGERHPATGTEPARRVSRL